MTTAIKTSAKPRNRRMARTPADQGNGKVQTGTKKLSAEVAQTAAKSSEASKKPTKIDKVIKLLRRKNGATLDELVKATGWLPHTARAAMTGLRKKGHAITRTKADGVSHYCIEKASA